MSVSVLYKGDVLRATEDLEVGVVLLGIPDLRIEIMSVSQFGTPSQTQGAG